MKSLDDGKVEDQSVEVPENDEELPNDFDGPPEGMDVDRIPLNPAWKGYKHLFKCHACVYKTSDQIQIAHHVSASHDLSKSETLGPKQKSTKDLARTFDCPICRANFPANTALYQHFKSKHNLRGAAIHLCHVCTSMFSCGESLQDHMIKNHPGLKKCQRCEVCYRAFQSPELLFLHVRGAHKKPLYLETIIQKYRINVAKAVEAIEKIRF